MGANSRQRMVETAARLFRRQGYHRTGFRQIIEVSGSPRGSIYHHFPGGKADVAVDAVAHGAAQVRDALDRIAAASPSSAELIRGFAAALAAGLEDSGFRDGCPVATVALECAPEEEGIADACRDAFRSWQRVFADALGREGVAAADADARGRLVVAAMEGALLLCRVERSTHPLREVADQVVAVTAGRAPTDPQDQDG